MGSTETLSMAGVEPFEGFTVSQPPPEDVETAAVKLTAAPLDDSEITCGAGLISPAWKLKESVSGLAISVTSDDVTPEAAHSTAFTNSRLKS